MTKIIRKIDRRNALFGQYKYQVKPGAMVGGSSEPRKWCREKWGNPRVWVDYNNLVGRNEPNPRWTEVKRPGWSSPFIYIRDEADAVMFGLAWAGK